MNVRSDLKHPKYVNAVVDVAAVGDRLFTYRVPGEFILPYGSRVYVPFGRTRADGYVVEQVYTMPEFKVKDILSVYDPEFLPPEPLLSLGQVLKEYYFSSTVSFWAYLWPPLVSRKAPESVIGAINKAAARQVLNQGQSSAVSSGVVFIQGSASYRWKIYIKAISKALSLGQGVVVLVPEIRKIETARAVLEPVCGRTLSLVHSELPGAKRRGEWLELLRGTKSVALGTRSAVFSPVRNLGLIIVDEEESTSYKAEEYPRYNAATVAKLRGEHENCRVFLGSFVPSVKTAYYVDTGKLKTEKEIFSDAVEIKHETVSMLGRRRRVLISKELHLALKEAFDFGERALLFVNKRGTSSSLVCTDCGNTVTCPRCSVSLSYHSKGAQLVCHTCGYRQSAPSECPLCHGYTWKTVGYGIDRAASEFKKRFPGIPVFQLDQDSKTPPEKVIEEFASVSPSCLLSTQMVLGFSEIPSIRTLGVLSCDNLLSFPDYRAPEEVFMLLTGLLNLLKNSGGSLSKRFVLQTLNPQNHAVQGALSPSVFYSVESRNRKALGYPPFGALLKIEFSGKDPDKVRVMSEVFASRILERSGDIQVLGPSPAPKAKVRGRYRWHIMLKAPCRDTLGDAVRTVLPEVSDANVKISVDTEEPFGFS